MKRRAVTQALSAALALPSLSWAQADRTLRIIVGFPAGGSIDVLARVLADKMKDDLKHPVIVENRAGAAGRVAAEQFKSLPPDGNSIMITPAVVPVLGPLVFNKLNYDPVNDLVPLSLLTRIVFALTVPAELPVRNVNELVAWYKANPQKAAFGSPGAGSIPHFFGLLLGRAAGVDVVHVPYSGGSALHVALLGNQVPAGIDVELEAQASHKAGKLRVIATSSNARTVVFPEVPTFAEQGFSSMVATSWFASFVPRNTPAAEIDRLHRAITKALALPDVTERFKTLGMEPVGSNPADLRRFLDAETAKWSPVVKASGFRAD